MTTSADILVLSIPEALNKVNAKEHANGVQVYVTLPANAVANDTITFTVTAPGNVVRYVTYTIGTSDLAAESIVITIPASICSTNGAYQISAVLTDENAVSTTPAPASFEVDRTAPARPAAPASYADDVGSIQSTASTAATTDDTKPGVQVGKNLTDTPKLYVDGVAVDATYDPVAGTLTPTNPLSEGAHAITFTLTDSAENESLKSPALNLTISTGAPVTPVDAPDNYTDDVGAIQNVSSTAAITDDNKPGIKVGAGLTDAPKLYVDGELVDAIYDPVAGTLTPTAELTDGLHTFAYSLTNTAGKESGQSPALNITIDTVAPVTPLTAPANYTDNIGAIQNVSSTAATTDDNKPGIKVGANLTDTPTLYVDGVKVDATYDAVAGTLTPVNALTDGAHACTYTLTDAGGLESGKSPALNITIDTVAPTTPLTAPANYTDNVGAIQNVSSTAATTDDNKPGIKVGANLTDKPKLYVDGALVDATYDAAAGTLTPVNALTDGAHAFTYTLTDAGGLESGKSPALNITIDTVAPTTPLTAPANYTDNVGTIQNVSSTAATTDDNKPGIKVGANLTDKPKLYVDGALVDATYDAAAGTLTPVNALTDGAHAFTYTLTDAGGLESGKSPALNITIDTVAPTTPLTAPANYTDNVGTIQNVSSTAATTDDNKPGIKVGANLTDTPTLYVDGVKVDATYDAVAGTLTPVNALTDGAHAFTYTLTDAGGLESGKSPALNITIDTVAPTTPLTAPANYTDNVGAIQNVSSTAATTDDNKPGIKVGANLTDTPTLYVDGVKVDATYDAVAGTLTPVNALTDGAHAFTYTLKDAGGLESGQSPALNITIDTVAPTTPLTAPANYTDNVGAIQNVSSTAATTDDNKPGIKVGANLTDKPKLYVDGALVDATYDAAAGTLTPVNALTDGAHAFTYTLTDAGGLESGKSPALNITIDTVAPTTPLTAPANYTDNVGTIQNVSSTAATTDDNKPGIKVGANLTDTPTLYVDGVKVDATYDAVAGTLTPVNALTDGAHAFTYTLTDAGGLESGKSPALNITIDTVAPTTPLTAPANYTDNVGAIQNVSSTAATTDDNKPGIKVGANLTDTPTLYVDGVKVDATYDAVAGTLTPVNALTDGAHAFTYTLKDAGGLESGQSPALNITIDTVAPTTPLTAPANYTDNVGAIQNVSSTAATTDDNKPGIKVGANLTDKPKLYVDGALVDATYDAAAGTLTPVNALTDGAHAFTYTLTDAGGLESGKSPALNITIDTVAPTTPLTAPANYTDNVGTIQNVSSTAATTDDNKPGIKVGANLTDTPTLYVDGVKVDATYDAVAGTLTPVNALTDGAHAFTYTLKDAGGLESGQSPALNITIDTVAPTTPLTAPANYTDNVGAIQNVSSTAATTDDNKPGIKVGANLTDTPTLYVDGVKVDATYDAVAGTLTPVNALTDGAHAFTYTLTDAGGLESGKSPALNITIDTVAPVAPLTAPANYTDNVGAIQNVSSTAATTDDNKPGIKVGANLTDTPTLYVDGVKVDATYDAVAGTLTPVNAVTDGAHAFTYTLTDAGGLESGKSPALNITIDTVAPVAPLTAPANYTDNVGAIQNVSSTAATTDDNKPGIKVGANLTDTPTLYVDGVKVDATYDAVAGTLTPVNAVTDGAHAFTYTLTDAGGLESGKSPALNITIDTVAPVFTSADAAAATNENVPVNTVVYTAKSTDAFSVTYALKANTGDSTKFSINAQTGVVTLLESPDYETKNSYSFTVVATDVSGNKTEKVISLAINNLNEAAVIEGDLSKSVTEADTVSAISTSGQLTATDVDGPTSFSAQADTVGSNGYGKFSLSTTGAWTYTANTAHNEFVAGKTYTDSFTVKTADGTSKVVAVTITGTNDRPTFTSSAVTLSGAEDTVYSFVIADSLVGQVADADAGAAVKGIAISWNQSNAGQGVWEWSADGTAWTTLPSDLSANNTANALYLNASDRLRFTPGDNFNGTVYGLVFRAADDTMPTTASGTRLNINNFIGSTGSMSYGPTSYSLNLTAVNDAPVLNINTVINMSAVNEDAAVPTGAAGSLVSDLASAISDVDVSALKGMAITSINGNGTLYFSTDAGTTWTAVTGSLSDSNALLLSQTSRVFFKPNADWNGTIDNAFLYRAWDQTNGATAGSKVNISATGATTAYSSEYSKVGITVNAVNDAPVGANDTNTATEAGGVNNAIAGANPSGNVLTNDTDVDNAANTLVVKDIVKGTAGTATAVAASTTSANGASIAGAYGTLVMGADGSYTYSVDQSNAAVQALNTNSTALNDVFTYTVKDPSGLTGTATITVAVKGANDTAVIAGDINKSLTEANVVLGTSGTLSISDVDSANTFVAETDVAGSNGYGKFTLTTAGAWSYVMDTAHDEFLGNIIYTDSFTATSADGTKKIVTVTINGTDDAAYIGGTSTATLTETDVVQNATGTLAVMDVDSPVNNTFVAQTNVAKTYGKFSVTAAGVWTYTMNTAHNEFVAGTPYTDSITVTSTAGLTKVVTVTITGTNDAAVITGTSTATLTETNAVLNASGSLTITDVDNAAAFVAQTGVTGSNGYGKFNITAAGAWTYATNTAHDEFVAGVAYTDSFTVSAVDGTTKVVTVTINGTDDAAVIGGVTTATLTEVDSAQTAGGKLTVTDIDSTVVNTTFAVQTNVAKTYGSFSINAAGEWTYVMSNAHDEFVAGTTYTDTFTVATTTPGVTKLITVTIVGSNDAAVIGGVSAATLTETNAVLNASGTLTITDVDSAKTFVAQSGIAGSNGYGKFSLTAAGTWNYALNTAHNEFVAGQAYTDSYTATSADGTTKVVTVTINGTNDAAVIAGTSTATLTETNVIQNATGTLTITDVDNTAAFVEQSNVVGSKGYGKFSVTAAGVWTYVMDTAHNEFVAGTSYTDSITVAAVDGTTKVVTVTIVGTNDAALITGASTAALTESNAVQNAGGTLTASDVDSAATFVAQTSITGTGGYGKFSITAAGVWTYAMNTAHNEFVAGTNYVDTVTVKTSDGTSQVLTVTMTGTNDAAVIAGTSAATLTESNVVQSTGGTLTITDVDSTAAFVAQTGVVGSNGYGKFSVTAAGAWTYAMTTAHDEFASGKAYIDSLTVTSVDGTTKLVTVTINGSDDAAYIGGTSTASLTETDGVQTAGGTVAVMDVDSAVNNTFVAQTNVAKTYGSFTISTAGVWSYVMSTAHNEFVAGTKYSDSITVTSATGLTKVITVTIVGTNDAAVIGGVSTANLTETNVAQSTGGTLTITDVDNTAAFVAQTAVAGSNGYGKFSVTAAGVWTYVMTTAHDEFLLNQIYTDSITVAAVDGTTKVVTVSITGTNDAPTLTYVDTGSSSTDAITNSAAMNVSSLETSATWEYQVDGGAWVNGTGTAFNMSEGQHTYNVRQKDSLNNVSAVTTKTVTLDTVAPNAAGFALASDAGISNTDGVTNNGTVNVSLSSDTNNWQYSTNGGVSWVAGSGTSFGVGAGVYAANSIQVQAFDKAGNATVSKYASGLTVDTSAPTVSVSIGNTGLRFGESTTVNFRFSEAVYGFANGDVSVSGGSLSNITGSGNSYSATFTAGYSYNGGSYVYVNANTYTDQAGNNGGAGSTGSFRVGPNVADVARGMSLYVTGYGHGWCDTQGWVGVGLWGNNDLQGATVRLYDDRGNSWSNNVAGSGGSTNFGNFSGGGANVTRFHADITYGGVTASVGGGVVYEVTWRGILGWGVFNCIKADTAYTFCYSSPIVLDLNGDGVQTVDTAHGVQFDMDADGTKQSVGWVDKHDALLVRDINHDGQINNGKELFGSDTVLKNGEKAGDGWAALSDIDTNGDGKVDAKDVAFAEIKVWVDANSNGVAEEGELRGLIEAGIQSVDVAHAYSNTTQNGNILFGTGQFTKADGSTSAVTDAWFEESQLLSLDFTQVADQVADMTDDKAQTLKLSLEDLLAHSAIYGALQISGDAADAVLVVNGSQPVVAQSQVVNGQTFNAYDLNHDGMNDLLVHQAMHQTQFA